VTTIDAAALAQARERLALRVFEAEELHKAGRTKILAQDWRDLRIVLDALREARTYLDVVFDGPPSHESGRFVEVENLEGFSVGVGEWIDRGNGYWALRLPVWVAAKEQS
jgi:hypothetical protein